MSGEGTGGGGAVTLLLGLWIAAMAFVLGDRMQQEAVADEPVGVLAPQTEVAGDPGVEAAAATPAPLVRDCASAKECATTVTRAELAVMFARAFELSPTTVDFFDDDDGRLEEAAINRVAAAGVTSGCGEREYCPDLVVTRDQLAIFLSRVVALPSGEAGQFTDVADAADPDAVHRVAAAGLVEGCGADAFCPGDPVSRGELTTILRRVLALDQEAA